MIAFKGFNQDLTCRGYQYKEGETHTTDKTSLCNTGFHACERPLDVFGYYPPAKSVYHEVELRGVDDERSSDDTKVCAKEIKIGARLSIRNLVYAHIEYVRSHTTTEHTDPERATAGNAGAATAGNAGAATAGNAGAATAGNFGAATAGYKGAATAGNFGAATAGNFGAATAGDSGAATAGNFGAATAGNSGAATAGNSGAATAGNSGAATSRGESAVGENGLAVARGNSVRVKGGLGALLVIAEENSCNYDIAVWKAVVVDGEVIKADTWYALKDGELVEVSDA